MTLQWIMNMVLTPVTYLTNWFLDALRAAGMKDYFFYFLGVCFIVSKIFRFDAPVSGGDIGQVIYDRKHPYKTTTSTVRTSQRQKSGNTVRVRSTTGSITRRVRT